MTNKADIVNRSLQDIGTRTTVTTAELVAESSNEAIQANLIYENTRDDLLRMAPWNCAFDTKVLTYITSVPGTPENTSAATSLWQKGQPAPPYAYEYQYPVDCLRACWVTPQTATGDANGIPITTAVTGGAPSFWQGPPVKFKTAIDQFYSATAVTIPTPGTGYAIGDLVIPANSTAINTITNRIANSANPFQIGQPQGAPPIVRVLTINGSGGILTAEVVSIIPDSTISYSGSLFYTYPQAGGTQIAASVTTGAGTGAVFSFTYADPRDQRVILTNQEFAVLNYCKQVTDENIFDTLFQTAFTNVLGGQLCMALTGDKGIANAQIGMANEAIRMARAVDGNEGLTVNDVTPDWIRVRGIWATEGYSGPYNTGYDFGAYWPSWA